MVLVAPSGPTANHRWILALLYAGAGRQKFNAPIGGRTRLMKELFLLKERGKFSADFYDFEASNYGPSSNDVMRDLSHLIGDGRVQVEPGFGGQYSLTPAGSQGAAKVWAALDDGTRRKIVAIKERFNFMPLSELLFEVYQSFPKYTAKSLIRDKVLAEYERLGDSERD